ncbi:hypothetical protein FRB96_002488 [Tulasnella sp. 330]|nr:hypothetical protein FRB96_002488 [Tulasnella sp. 330]KAG8877099.1 hypothetical protein FRB98_006903 [Tulasnella sp. 332]
MLSDDDSLFGDDKDGDDQTASEIPKLALPSLKRKSVVDTRGSDNDEAFMVGTSALSVSPLPVSEQAIRRPPTESFPHTRPSRGEATQHLITPSSPATHASCQHLPDEDSRANTQPQNGQAGRRAAKCSTSVLQPSRPTRTTRRRQAQSSQQPPPTVIPNPLGLTAPQPHLQPILNVLRSDESITSILTALLAHLKDGADQNNMGRRPIKRRTLDPIGREMSEEEWRISRTRQLVAILSSALKRVMDRIRLTEAIASADDPIGALDDVVRTAQDEMMYQRTIGKWLMDKQLVHPETTPATTPSPSTPGSATVTYVPLTTDVMQSKQALWQPLHLDFPVAATVDTSLLGYTTDEFGPGSTSGDQYWSDLIRLLDNYGAEESTGTDRARIQTHVQPPSASSTVMNENFFSQLMRLGSASSSIGSPFEGTSSSYTRSPDPQSFPPAHTFPSSNITDPYIGMQIDPDLAFLSWYPPPPAISLSASETLPPPILQAQSGQDPSVISVLTSVPRIGIVPRHGPAYDTPCEDSERPAMGLDISGSPPQPTMQVPDIEMADNDIVEVEPSAQAKGKQKEVVWADEQTSSSHRPISAPLPPISVPPSLPELLGSHKASQTSVVAPQRKARMRSVLYRARGQRQKMQAAMDDALKQLWELELEHATLAKVVKGVTMKEAVLSKK